MTKKHYIATAKVFERASHLEEFEDPAGFDMFCKLMYGIADVFQKDNPRFDAQRFFTACTGIPS